LAVRPNPNSEPLGGNSSDAIFNLADRASSSDEQSQIRRTITMVSGSTCAFLIIYWLIDRSLLKMP
jgi:hypothetical protein